MKRKNHAAMMRAFTAFSCRIAKRYSEVEDCLRAGRYEEAHYLLSQLTQSHAKTSLSLRNFLVREGELEDR